MYTGGRSFHSATPIAGFAPSMFRSFLWRLLPPGLLFWLPVFPQLLLTCRTRGLFLSLLKSPVLPPALLRHIGSLLALPLCYGGGAAVVAVGNLVEARSEEAAGNQAVLRAGAGGLRLDDDARRKVFDLDSGVGFVLFGQWASGRANPGGGGKLWAFTERRQGWVQGNPQSSGRQARCPSRRSLQYHLRAAAWGAAGGCYPSGGLRRQ